MVSFVYPFPDPNIALAHDNDGIARGRQPNRRVNGEIIPGLFFVVRLDDSGELTDLSPEDTEQYTKLFAKPESFPPGHWKVHTATAEKGNCCIIRIISEWAEVSPENKEETI